MEPRIITYLLGAGASANCLPVVCNMADGIADVIKVINAQALLCLQDSALPKLIPIVAALSNLEIICRDNYSVDTYAKKLYLSQKIDEYYTLKDDLSLYFTLQQKIKNLDNRYDNFWAALLTNRHSFPENLRVVSWNYDSQIELSYQGFCSNSSLQDAYDRIRMTSLHTSQTYFYTDKFSVIKLNGSAKFKEDVFMKDDFKYLTDDFTVNKFDTEFFENLFDVFDEIKLLDKVKRKRVNKNELSFAWEHDFESKFYENLSVSLKNTSVLVVIGYSFPIYNRKVDKKIINEFMPNLEKVYLQAPDAEDLKDRFLAITDRIYPANIILKKDIGQFVFPTELDI